MSDTQAAAAPSVPAGPPAYALTPDQVLEATGSDAGSGLSAAEVDARLASHGPNAITAEKPPSAFAVAAVQLRDPMNIMLVAVVVVSLAIGEVSTGVLVALLIVLNVVLGTRQELTARASVDALAKMQVPQARVVRDGAARPQSRRPRSCPATSCSSRRATSSRPTGGSSGPPRSRPRRQPSRARAPRSRRTPAVLAVRRRGAR